MVWGVFVSLFSVDKLGFKLFQVIQEILTNKRSSNYKSMNYNEDFMRNDSQFFLCSLFICQFPS